MYAVDFEYDGKFLSDFGFIICNFGGRSDADTISAGSKISFNTVPRHSGKVFGLAGSSYDECVTASFSVCKDPCVYEDIRITNYEFRDIMRWLNRREFLKTRFWDDDGESEACYYDASFTIDKVLVDDNLYGLDLTMETNRPFGYGDEVVFSWTSSSSSSGHIVADLSDEIGYTYPSIKITVRGNGDLRITNETYDSIMLIKNCSSGEVITINGDTQTVMSSLSSHKIYNDFNFEYLRIGNTIENRNNNIVSSLPCDIEMRYVPIIKDTPD